MLFNEIVFKIKKSFKLRKIRHYLKKKLLSFLRF